MHVFHTLLRSVVCMRILDDVGHIEGEGLQDIGLQGAHVLVLGEIQTPAQ